MSKFNLKLILVLNPTHQPYAKKEKNAKKNEKNKSAKNVFNFFPQMAMRKELADTTLPLWMGMLDNLVGQNVKTNGPFCCGKAVTTADLHCNNNNNNYELLRLFTYTLYCYLK
jgi:hypothetical protein